MMKKIITSLFMVVLMVMSSMSVMGDAGEAYDADDVVDGEIARIDAASPVGSYWECVDSDKGLAFKTGGIVTCTHYSADDEPIVKKEFTDYCGYTLNEFLVGTSASETYEDAYNYNDATFYRGTYEGTGNVRLDFIVHQLNFNCVNWDGYSCNNENDACTIPETWDVGTDEEETEETTIERATKLPECKDGVDNDDDGKIDLSGGCDINKDGKLSSKVFVAQWGIWENEMNPIEAGKAKCTDYYGGIWYDADSICVDAGYDSYNSENTRITSAPQKPECNDGLDNEGDGYLDYDNGNGGWCDVDNDGAISVKALSGYTNQYVSELTLTECQCNNEHGPGDLLCVTEQRTFLQKLFGRGTSESVGQGTTSGKDVDESGSVANPEQETTTEEDTSEFGRGTSESVGQGTSSSLGKGSVLEETPTVDEEAQIAKPNFLQRVFGYVVFSITGDATATNANPDTSGSIKGTTGENTIPVTKPESNDVGKDLDESGSVATPKESATWFSADPNCDDETDDSEAGPKETTPELDMPELDIETGYCSDGWDNDDDGLVDLNDFGCSNALTYPNDEYNQCGDGYDNDHDGYTDTKDPECSDESDDKERDGNINSVQ